MNISCTTKLSPEWLPTYNCSVHGSAAICWHNAAYVILARTLSHYLQHLPLLPHPEACKENLFGKHGTLIWRSLSLLPLQAEVAVAGHLLLRGTLISHWKRHLAQHQLHEGNHELVIRSLDEAWWQKLLLSVCIDILFLAHQLKLTAYETHLLNYTLCSFMPR